MRCLLRVSAFPSSSSMPPNHLQRCSQLYHALAVAASLAQPGMRALRDMTHGGVR
jgi:hypothetical protein